MSGPTVCDLVRLMEAHPTAGLIQTAPYLINAHSAFARFQQFANQLYGPLFSAGLNYWSQDGGNYWGHNAIIRTEPFMQFCDLPELPGRKPFGGQILSHDFVEAALLRKEDWEVWFAYDLDGSYEEGPPGIIENAQRDRRWCQGNLQHAMLLFTRGFDGVSRVHLSQGILGYVAAPLWLLFMIVSSYLLWYHKQTGLSEIAVAPFTPYLRLSAAHHALLVFCLGMTVIFLPKVLSLVDLLWDKERRRDFGGLGRAAASVVVETLFSTLHAPLQMLFHTKFVVTTLLGVEVHWGSQQRTANGTTWRAAMRQHWLHTVIGLVWGAFAWWLGGDLFWWFVPVCAGLVLSVPLSVLTSRATIGEQLRKAGLMLTREETFPPPQLARLNARLEAQAADSRKGDTALCEAIRDPYLNALHVAMVGEGTASEKAKDETRVFAAGSKFLAGNVDELETEEQELLASRADVMAKLHQDYWTAQSERR
jgi:membrane glycosyltransferase